MTLCSGENAEKLLWTKNWKREAMDRDVWRGSLKEA